MCESEKEINYRSRTYCIEKFMKSKWKLGIIR